MHACSFFVPIEYAAPGVAPYKNAKKRLLSYDSLNKKKRMKIMEPPGCDAES